jgi:hypothetical protein
VGCIVQRQGTLRCRGVGNRAAVTEGSRGPRDDRLGLLLPAVWQLLTASCIHERVPRPPAWPQCRDTIVPRDGCTLRSIPAMPPASACSRAVMCCSWHPRTGMPAGSASASGGRRRTTSPPWPWRVAAIQPCAVGGSTPGPHGSMLTLYLSFAQMEHQVRRTLCQPLIEIGWEL